VAELWDSNWNIKFRRSFNGGELEEWDELVICLEQVEMKQVKDQFVWKLEKLDNFTARLIYRMVTCSGVIDVRMKEI